MERKITDLWENARDKFKKLGKLKYTLLLAAAGIGILLLPNDVTPAPVPEESIPAITEADAERKIEEILSQVQGAGKVKVMLTLKNDGFTEYQTDTDESTDGEREEIKTQTVFHQDTALVRYHTFPEYLGAVVVCQGGDSPKVCLELVKAVCSLTGLTSDKITVLKMKNY